jgi:hypothetical protein
LAKELNLSQETGFSIAAEGIEAGNGKDKVIAWLAVRFESSATTGYKNSSAAIRGVARLHRALYTGSQPFRTIHEKGRT